MLTRRQAKLRGVVVGAEPPAVQVKRTSIDKLSDLSLELAFSFLDTEDLIIASQVCRRWRGLCSSRRLWSGRRVAYHGETLAESERVVRLLRRQHGVVTYNKVTLKIGAPLVTFEDGGDTLAVVTSSFMMLVLCLRHLVKDHVTALHVFIYESYPRLTPLEALFVWETIASKTKLQSLGMNFYRSSSLIGTNFKWPLRGSLIDVSLGIDDDPAGPLCRPFQSLLQLHRCQLQRVHIYPEHQQPLLQFKPTCLRNLQAVLLPSLIDVLKPISLLNHLFLHSAKSDPALSCRVLTSVMAMPNVRRSLYTLDVTLTVSNASEGEDVIALLAGFEVLVWLRLRGVCSVLGDPERGPGALQSLLTALPLIRELTLDLDPFSFPLEALLPHTADGVTSEPLVRVPASLALLALGRAKVVRRVAEVARWLQQLRRLVVDAANLHVQCEDVRLHAEGRGRATQHSSVVFLPHPTEHYCQSCPGVAAKKKGYSVMFVGEFFKE